MDVILLIEELESLSRLSSTLRQVVRTQANRRFHSSAIVAKTNIPTSSSSSGTQNVTSPTPKNLTPTKTENPTSKNEKDFVKSNEPKEQLQKTQAENQMQESTSKKSDIDHKKQTMSTKISLLNSGKEKNVMKTLTSYDQVPIPKVEMNFHNLFTEQTSTKTGTQAVMKFNPNLKIVNKTKSSAVPMKTSPGSQLNSRKTPTFDSYSNSNERNEKYDISKTSSPSSVKWYPATNISTRSNQEFNSQSKPSLSKKVNSPTPENAENQISKESRIPQKLSIDKREENISNKTKDISTKTALEKASNGSEENTTKALEPKDKMITPTEKTNGVNTINDANAKKPTQVPQTGKNKNDSADSTVKTEKKSGELQLRDSNIDEDDLMSRVKRYLPEARRMIEEATKIITNVINQLKRKFF